MPADILSLSKARKAKAKTAKEAKAAENRVLFGRTKAERQTEAARLERTKRALDGHQRNVPSEQPDEN